MQTIYLIVGKKIRQAEARIIGRIAEVQTPYGPREFGVWYGSINEATSVLDKRRDSASTKFRRN